MKILFIQKEGGIFGAENFQLKIIPALLDKGVKIEFLRLYTDYQGGIGGDFISQLNDIGVATYEINIGKLPKFNKLIQIKKLIEEGEFDLVHTHLIHADLHLSLIKLFLGGISCPWLSTKHGYDNAFTAKYGFNANKQTLTLYFLLTKLSERLCDKSYTISHGLRNFFIATGITKAEKMDMIHYGFDLPETSDKLIDPDFKKFKKQIVIAGRLVAFKGHSYLLEALSLLRQEMTGVGLVIVGSGGLKQQLQDKVKTLNIESSVYFAGYSKEVSKWMYNSDVVAVPSISEGFGVVFLEAFNCKKAVVSWDVPAGNELLDHEKTGYLVQAYNISALADQLESILVNKDQAERVGNNSYEILKKDYSLNRMANETLDLYQNLIKS